jgi:hypothetical protein
MWDAARDLGEIMAFSDRRIRKAIQPATDPLQLSSAMQPEQVFSRNPDPFNVAGPDDRSFACQPQQIWPGRLLHNVYRISHV